MSSSEPGSKSPSANKLNLRRVIVPAMLLCAVLVGGAAWMIIAEKNKIHDEASWAEQRFGLRAPVPGRLDSRFSDADNDLLADPPDEGLVSPETLKFSYIASGKPGDEEQKWQPFLDRLSAATNLPVEYLSVETIAEQLAALKEGRLHVTAFNTGNVPRAVNECGFIPVSAKADEKGDWRITMKLIVPRDSQVREVRDLRRKSITFTNPSSFSGFKFAVVVLQDEFEMRLGRDYDYRFSTSHEESIRAVAAGDQDSATVASDMLELAFANGLVDRDAVREVYASRPFPSAAFGYLYNLDPQLAEKIRQFLTDSDLSGTPIEGEGDTAGGKLAATSYLDDWQAVRDVDAAIAVDEKAKSQARTKSVEGQPDQAVTAVRMHRGSSQNLHHMSWSPQQFGSHDGVPQSTVFRCLAVVLVWQYPQVNRITKMRFETRLSP